MVEPGPDRARGRFNLWVWEDTRRRWTFVLIALMVAVVILTQLVRNAHGSLDHPGGIVAVLASVFIVGLVLREAARSVLRRR